MHEEQPGVTFDQLSTELQQLRAAAGAPSYSELVRRVSDLRVARGVPVEQARPARSTLYDAFRTGRRRMDVQLVADLAQALGADEAEVARWRERCRTAVPGPRDPAPPAPEEPEEPEAPVAAAAPPAGDAPTSVPEPAPAEPPDVPAGSSGRSRGRRVAAVVLLSLLVNLLGRGLVEALGLTLYLDMVGTAVASIVLGPWWGVLVGVGTNVAGVRVSGAESLPFALVQVAGALVWGYGVRRFGMGRSTARFLALNVVVAATCTLVAAPILLMYDVHVGHASEDIIATARLHTHNLVAAVLSGNAITSTADKLISGFVALAVLDVLRGSFPEAHRRVAPATDLLHPRAAVVATRSRVGSRSAAVRQPR